MSDEEVKQYTVDDFMKEFKPSHEPGEDNIQIDDGVGFVIKSNPAPERVERVESVESVERVDNIQIDDSVKSVERQAPQVEITTIKGANKPKRTRRKRCKDCDEMYYPQDFEDPQKHSCISPPAEDPTHANIQTEEEPNEPSKGRQDPSTASKNLYNLQFTAYYMIESALQSTGNNHMDGLTTTMEDMRDQYLHVFEQVYEEYGSEYLDEVLSPVVLWSMMTTQNVASTFMKNKKKK